jgi:hypothetical protein
MSPHQEDGRYILPNSSLVVSTIMLMMKKSQSVENAFDNDDERLAMPLMLMDDPKENMRFITNSLSSK